MTSLVDEGWEQVCQRAELSNGEKREVTLADSTLVLLIATNEGVFACCADCPHQDTPLIDGPVDGTVLTCPEHFWQWDLKNGEPMGIAELPLTLFETAENDGKIFVRKTR